MNISKPTNVQHNVHAKYDPETRTHVVCPFNENQPDHKSMSISPPTEFKHNLHATINPATKEIVFCSPIKDLTLDNTDECHTCKDLYCQWKKGQVKIKELQEENHCMLALAARLCRFASDIYGQDWDKNQFKCSSNLKHNGKEFEESMMLTADSFMTMKNEYLRSKDTIHILNERVKEMKEQIYRLETQLKDSNQKKIHELNTMRTEAKNRMLSMKTEFDRRVERAEKELSMLKSHLTELYQENKNLRMQLRDLKISFTECHYSGSRISSALHQDMSLLELKKENESLKLALKQVEKEKTRLNEEVTTTMHQFFKQTMEPCSRSHMSTSEKPINYNINAKAVNFIENSAVRYEQEGEFQESEEDMHI